jgi:hypothetical protein
LFLITVDLPGSFLSDSRDLASSSPQVFMDFPNCTQTFLLQHAVCTRSILLQPMYLCSLFHYILRTPQNLGFFSNSAVLKLSSSTLFFYLRLVITSDVSMSTCNKPFTNNRYSMCSLGILIGDPCSLIYTFQVASSRGYLLTYFTQLPSFRANSLLTTCPLTTTLSTNSKLSTSSCN